MHRRPHRTAAEDRPVHDERERHPEHELEPDREERDDQRVGDVAPPDRRRQHVAVVGEADELRRARAESYRNAR